MQLGHEGTAKLLTEILSQFPFWDFFECNMVGGTGAARPSEQGSQFPFWDFGECNQQYSLKTAMDIENHPLSIPFLGFR